MLPTGPSWATSGHAKVPTASCFVLFADSSSMSPSSALSAAVVLAALQSELAKSNSCEMAKDLDALSGLVFDSTANRARLGELGACAGECMPG